MAKSEHTPRNSAKSHGGGAADLHQRRALKASLQDRRILRTGEKGRRCFIRPAAGAISERLVQRGEYLRENVQVATIVQLNRRLQTSVQEKYSDIRQNMPVKLVESF